MKKLIRACLLLITGLLIQACGSSGDLLQGGFIGNYTQRDVFIGIEGREIIILSNVEEEIEDFNGYYFHSIFVNGVDFSQYADLVFGSIVIIDLPMNLIPEESYEITYRVDLYDYDGATYSKEVSGSIVIANPINWENPFTVLEPYNDIRFDWSLARNNQLQSAYSSLESNYTQYYEQNYNISSSARTFTFPINYLDNLNPEFTEYDIRYEIDSYNYYLDEDVVIISLSQCSVRNESYKQSDYLMKEERLRSICKHIKSLM